MSTISLGRAPSRRVTIGAHADHRTTDFFFPRVQSLETRDLPWERRTGRIYSWFEIGGYTAALVGAGAVAVAMIL
jgi:hypothetical protein